MSDNCTFCDTSINQNTFFRFANKSTSHYECDRCGKYSVNDLVFNQIDFNKVPNSKAILSYWIQTNQNKENPPYITTELVKNILTDIKLPDVGEQVHNLILYLGNTSNYPGEILDITLNNIIAKVGSKDKESLLFIFDYIIQNNLVEIQKFGKDSLRNKNVSIFKCNLSVTGWGKFEEFNKPSLSGKIVFMAMKYDNVELEEVYSENIKDAVKQTGFDIQLLKNVLRAGSIDDQIRIQIRSAKFLIADLTDDNNGAYWEAGFAEGLNKPVIYLCEKNKFNKFKTHFDTNHLTTVLWKRETIKEDMENLKAIIRNTFPVEAILED